MGGPAEKPSSAHAKRKSRRRHENKHIPNRRGRNRSDMHIPNRHGRNRSDMHIPIRHGRNRSSRDMWNRCSAISTHRRNLRQAPRRRDIRIRLSEMHMHSNFLPGVTLKCQTIFQRTDLHICLISFQKSPMCRMQKTCKTDGPGAMWCAGRTQLPAISRCRMHRQKKCPISRIASLITARKYRILLQTSIKLPA